MTTPTSDAMQEYLHLIHQPVLAADDLRRAVVLAVALGRSVMRDRRTIGVVRRGERHVSELPKALRDLRRTRKRIAELRSLEGSIEAAIRGVQNCRNQTEALKAGARVLFPVE